MEKITMNRSLIGTLALLIFFAVGCGNIGTISKGTSLFVRMYDDMYDNNSLLVNPNVMKIEKIIDSIYFLHTDTEFKLEDGEVYTAELDSAGVVIFGRYILTVSHAVSHDSLQVEMLTPVGIQRVDIPADKLSEHTYLKIKGTRIELEEVVKGKEDDIAIFKVPDGLDLNSFPYEIGNSDDLRVGNFIYVIGNPMNYGINVREGIVSSMVAPEAIAAILPRFENAFMISNGVNPGDSGTPVIGIRDGQYELVGLSQGIFKNTQNLSWAIKINPIINRLNGLVERPSPLETGRYGRIPEDLSPKADDQRAPT